MIVGKVIFGTMLLMKHLRILSKGFSLIEVMATMAIMGILASFAAPNYQKMRWKVLHQAEVQTLIETIIDARNAALTNRKCINGVDPNRDSVSWKVIVGISPLDFQLKCFYDDTNSVDKDLIEPIHTEFDGLVMTPLEVGAISDVVLTFFSGAANGKLQYITEGTTKKATDVRMTFGQLETSLQSTICFNPISGFPTFNKHGSTCQTLN